MMTEPAAEERGFTGRFGRWLPETFLALVSATVFLGFLGSVELWGKREQRAAAEALDTIDDDRWLVARIQGRPRLEKPPLPRWTTASLMKLTGIQSEGLVRLPAALSALGMVGLVYLMGRRIGGRPVGLAAGLALATTGYFVVEMRQAGNDGPLAFFVTLAIYAAWRRLEPVTPAEAEEAGAETEAPAPGAVLGARGWALLMWAALGLSFLSKGPIGLLLASLALVPWLAWVGRLGPGLRALLDLRGIALFIVLALCWPVPVMVSIPQAPQVWWLEMGQKAGTAGVQNHKFRHILAADWPSLVAPWLFLALWAAARPLRTSAGVRRALALPACWAILNLAMFCFWRVAKPNYYLPCLPAIALLVGWEWVHLTRRARESDRGATRARRILIGHAIALTLVGLAIPVAAWEYAPTLLAWAVLVGAAMAASTVAGVMLWRRGADALALAPAALAAALAIVVGYGVVGPTLNPQRGHRELARALDAVLPPDAHTVRFFHEIDEGLWFYLRDRKIEPVPGSQPRISDAFDLVDDYNNGLLVWDPKQRVALARQCLVDWMNNPERRDEYILIRKNLHRTFLPAIRDLSVVVFDETNKGRNELVLLKVSAPASSIAQGTTPARQ